MSAAHEGGTGGQAYRYGMSRFAATTAAIDETLTRLALHNAYWPPACTQTSTGARAIAPSQLLDAQGTATTKEARRARHIQPGEPPDAGEAAQGMDHDLERELRLIAPPAEDGVAARPRHLGEDVGLPGSHHVPIGGHGGADQG